MSKFDLTTSLSCTDGVVDAQQRAPPWLILQITLAVYSELVVLIYIVFHR